jgi:hypothetical protein
MINYKLAYELKQLGFPQDLTKGDWFYTTALVSSPTPVLVTSKKFKNGSDFDGSAKIPTLEDMINFMGTDFWYLQREEVDIRYQSRTIVKLGSIYAASGDMCECLAKVCILYLRKGHGKNNAQ